MTQKQTIGVVLGVGVVVVLGYYIYQMYSGDRAMLYPQSQTMVPSGNKGTKTTEAPVPESIDDIAESISSESAIDLSALDEEESGETADINEDSESVNNLGTSYDENSY